MLAEIFATVYECATTEMAEFLAERHGLDYVEVQNSIKMYFGRHPEFTPPPTPKKSSPKLKTKTVGKKICKFIVTKGTSTGHECGTVIRGGIEKYCSKHRSRQ